MPEKSISLEFLIDFYDWLDKLEIKIWIDGGWGVDVLLGRQTRPHKDLDIAMEQGNVPRLRELLGARGYRQIRKDNKWNFVLGDNAGHDIDVHSFVFDEAGQVIDGLLYPSLSLTGTGMINNHLFRCIAPEYMVKFHSGYELSQKDFRDVSALCEKFKLTLPDEYSKFL